MKLFEKYTRENLTGHELEELSERVLQSHFAEEDKARWTRRLAEEFGVRRNPVKVKTAYHRWWIGLAAAIAGLVVWTIFPSQPNQLQQLTDEMLAVPFANSEERKSLDSLSELKVAAIAAYNQGDFKTAAARRQQYVDQTTAAGKEDFFYLGISYLYQRPARPKRAVEQLEKAYRFTGGRYHRETRWFLALAYIKDERYSDARPLLQMIVTDAKWRVEEAMQLLAYLPSE